VQEFEQEILTGAAMDFAIGFTDKDITPWVGMALMKRILEQCDIDGMIKILGLPEPGSN
jgi:hypothetical protein